MCGKPDKIIYKVIDLILRLATDPGGRVEARKDGAFMGEINVYDPRFSALKRMQRSGKNASTILQDNRNLVMQLIYENGSISRKQLADITGLQLATITIIIKELLAQNLIRESGRVDGGSAGLSRPSA